MKNRVVENEKLYKKKPAAKLYQQEAAYEFQKHQNPMSHDHANKPNWRRHYVYIM